MTEQTAAAIRTVSDECNERRYSLRCFRADCIKRRSGFPFCRAYFFLLRDELGCRIADEKVLQVMMDMRDFST
jgi:hypothetical protein